VEEFFLSIKIPATILHVLSVVFTMGGALVSDGLFSFYSKDKMLDKKELSTLEFLSNLVLYGLVIVFISGVALFLGSMQEYLHSNKFLAKMTILAVLLINGFVLNKFVWSHLLNQSFFISEGERKIRRLAFACGAISLISWLSVCTLGVLDGLSLSYVNIVFIYFMIVMLGVIAALLVEKHELN
jgi:hypothetical protein